MDIPVILGVFETTLYQLYRDQPMKALLFYALLLKVGKNLPLLRVDKCSVLTVTLACR